MFYDGGKKTEVPLNLQTEADTKHELYIPLSCIALEIQHGQNYVLKKSWKEENSVLSATQTYFCNQTLVDSVDIHLAKHYYYNYWQINKWQSSFKEWKKILIDRAFYCIPVLNF